MSKCGEQESWFFPSPKKLIRKLTRHNQVLWWLCQLRTRNNWNECVLLLYSARFLSSGLCSVWPDWSFLLNWCFLCKYENHWNQTSIFRKEFQEYISHKGVICKSRDPKVRFGLSESIFALAAILSKSETLRVKNNCVWPLLSFCLKINVWILEHGVQGNNGWVSDHLERILCEIYSKEEKSS